MRNGWLGLIVASLIVLVVALLNCPVRARNLDGGYAANELQGQPFSEVVETGKKHGVKVEQLSAANTMAMDEAIPNRPRPSAIFLLMRGSSVVIVLVQDGMVIFSGNPIDLAEINKILSRTAA